MKLHAVTRYQKRSQGGTVCITRYHKLSQGIQTCHNVLIVNHTFLVCFSGISDEFAWAVVHVLICMTSVYFVTKQILLIPCELLNYDTDLERGVDSKCVHCIMVSLKLIWLWSSDTITNFMQKFSCLQIVHNIFKEQYKTYILCVFFWRIFITNSKATLPLYSNQ